MSGTVELAPDGAHLLIRFPFREDLVAEVKEVPGRRWDPRQKTWRVPAAQIEMVYARFTRHLFEFAPEVSGLLAGTLGNGAAVTAPAAANGQRVAAMDVDADAAPESLSISALNQRVRDGLRSQFPQRLWITGEIVDYDKQQDRQHKFFSLVEKAPGEARPRARVEAAMFERAAEVLLPRLLQQAPDFELRDGIEIRALVRLDLYVPSGRFQVVVEDLDPSFTLGKLALLKEQILRELRARGLAEANRSLPLPVPPLRVGALTSPDSDAWNDFLRHLQQSGIGFDVTLVPARVQGPELRPSMLQGLEWFAAHSDRFDVLCILRGGGSRTDLAWFDDLGLAVAVARHPLKVLVGIGHERDQSVLDVIAHSEKTPTAVAGHLVDTVVAARRSTAATAVRLQRCVAQALARAAAELADAGALLRQAVAGRLVRDRLRLRTAARDLGRGAVRALQGRHQEVQRHVDRCRHGAARQLERAAARLDQQEARRRLLDPVAVLRRGFAIVRTEDGRVLPEAARVRGNDLLLVQLRDGTVRSRAEPLTPAP
jgi:exodeoxyribonuclease VII large subunit